MKNLIFENCAVTQLSTELARGCEFLVQIPIVNSTKTILCLENIFFIRQPYIFSFNVT